MTPEELEREREFAVEMESILCNVRDSFKALDYLAQEGIVPRPLVGYSGVGGQRLILNMEMLSGIWADIP